MRGALAIGGGLLAALAHAQCPASGRVTYQGRSYALVQVAGQCWFAENLAATAFSNGDAVPLVDDPDQWNPGGPVASARAGTPKRDSTLVPVHGLYYNGYAALDERGICPEGWRVPSHADWVRLETALGCGESAAETFGFRGGIHGDLLKRSLPGFDEWTGSDHLGWGAVPAGFRTADGGDFNFGDSGFFWSSTLRSPRSLYIRGLNCFHSDVYSSEMDLAEGCSIRCLRSTAD